MITNTEKFTKILPKYFKTKNYASFVRQLNMYSFRKVKSKAGLHEFRHEKFNRHRPDDLKAIKRKINDFGDAADNFTGESKALMAEYNRLKRNHSELEESLKTLVGQNRKLIEANKDLVCQMYYSKADNELRTRKLLFLFFVVMRSNTPELSALIHQTFVQAGILAENEKFPSFFSFKAASEHLKKISYKLTYNIDKNHTFLDKLMDTFINYLRNLDPDNPSFQIKWDDILRLGPDEQLTTGAPALTQRDGHAHGAPQPDRLADLQQKSDFDRGSILDIRSENFNDLDCFGNNDQNLSSVQSVREHFLDSDFSAMNVKSPQSEQNSLMNFSKEGFK